MKEITFFYLKTCPFCRRADSFIAELIRETPEYAGITITKIEENEHREISDRYDYELVPAFYIGDELIFSGAPQKEDIKEVLDRALV